ncbi:MAG: hypothetical protein QOJ26_709 [Thermoplasmata archaeon]|nr:hypothetical protein [Thermoplasmata archaeon]MEA3165843.1 hypothetical protein [Thermoplasmata archaeon]
MRHGWLLVLLGLLLVLPGASAQDDNGPVEVTVTVAVTSFGNYDATTGTYVLDFYLVLEWDPAQAPGNFTAANFEMANGRATARDLQFNETDEDTGARRLWYRVQADLYSEPKYDWYPFDKQTVEVRIEDKVYTADQLVYVVGNGTLEDNFRPAGWQVAGTDFQVVDNKYSFDEQPYSQARFVVTLKRTVLSGVLKVIVPPLAFVAISAVTFFLVGKEKIATRFALSGNMAISGILFHAAQSATLPSLSRLIFLDRYMLAIEVFLFGSVVVTSMVAWAEAKGKDAARTKRLNWRGAAIVGAAAVGVFFLLFLVDVAPKVAGYAT